MRISIFIITQIVVAFYSSIVTRTEEVTDDRDSKVKALCADLSLHKQNFEMTLLVQTIRDLWLLMFPDEVGAEMKAELRITCEGHMNEILKACALRTELRVEIMRGQSRLQQAGVIDIRTLEGPNSTHLVIKQRYKKPSCGGLAQLLNCIEPDMFKELYPTDKVILFAFTYNVNFKEVITDWVALLYQKGDLLGAQERAKCIRSKEFNHLSYKDKLILDYVEASASGTST